jgi:hypothetical protein
MGQIRVVRMLRGGEQRQLKSREGVEERQRTRMGMPVGRGRGGWEEEICFLYELEGGTRENGDGREEGRAT